jgi:hypothetical protein
MVRVAVVELPRDKVTVDGVIWTEGPLNPIVAERLTVPEKFAWL